MDRMSYLLQGLVLGFSAAASPGSFQAYLIAQSIQNGWRRAWPAMFAPLVSDGPIVALVLLVLLAVPHWLVRGLRLAGGLFLLYLAWNVLRGVAQPLLECMAASQSLKRCLSPGVLQRHAGRAGCPDCSVLQRETVGPARRLAAASSIWAGVVLFRHIPTVERPQGMKYRRILALWDLPW